MWSIRAENVHDEVTQIDKLDGFHGILGEAIGGGFTPTLTHDVGGERDDRYRRVAVLLFPSTNPAAGFVASHNGHFDVGLSSQFLE